MKALQKIGDVSDRYNVTGRTLRYYEEIGLLWSERPPFTQQRYYDAAAVGRLEQILLLRRLDLSVREIQEIFASRDLRVAVDAFARKLRSLDDEIERLDQLRGMVASFLKLLQEKGYDCAGGLRLLQDHPELIVADQVDQCPPKKEVSTVPAALDHVRIIKLLPMQVAYYQTESPTPEEDAWGVMLKFADENGLLNLPTTRFFGFNNPDPKPGNPDHGYEVWVTIPEGTAPSGPIGIKPFSGGLYAVANTYLYEIGERWQALAAWVKQSPDYVWGSHQWLEETTSPDKTATPSDQLQLDLYLPINPKSS